MRLLLLPGIDGTARLFEPLVRELPDELPASPIPYPHDPRLGYDELVRRVEERAPRDEPWAIVAESYSGPIAIRIAAGRPSGLRALVLSATFAASPYPSVISRMRWIVRPVFVRFRPHRAILRHVVLDRSAPEELVDFVQDVNRELRPDVIAHRVREVLATDVRPLLPSIRVPTLLLAPERDRLLGRRGARQFLGHVPDLTVEWLDAPHMLLQRRPEEAARAIRSFLAAH